MDLEGEVEHPLPLVGILIVLDHRERHRSVDLCREPQHPVHLAVGAVEVLAEHTGRRELEDARARGGESASHREQLVLGRERPGHGLAVDGAVGDGA